MEGGKRVAVIDVAGRVLDSTHPGKARILVHSGKAKMISTQPPAIRLNYHVERGGTEMVKNFTQYFAEEPEIIVQNISGTVVSLTFFEPNSNREEHIRVENNRHPIVLTEQFPKSWIVNSPSFLKMLNHKPFPKLQLLTRTDYDGLLEKIAQQTKKSVAQVASKLRDEVAQAQDPQPIVKQATPDLDTLDEQQKHLDIPGESNEVSSRVLQLSTQCATDLPEDKRLSAEAMLDELILLPPLSIVDLNYLATNPWKSVRTWAQQKLMELTVNSEGPKTEPEPVKAKKPKAKAASEAVAG